MKRHAVIALAVGTMVALVAASASAQTKSSMEGRELYQTYCASCHGPTGMGNGPVAGALKKPPSNLTLFTVSNGGTFPAARLRRIIDGREVMAHGTPDMPVWGAVFKVPGRGVREEDVRARIDAIVTYVESIQVRRGH